MRDGFGPADQDAYETRIAPIAKEHGMALDSAYGIQQFLGGSGPKQASTLKVWSLASADAVRQVMSDTRYQAQMPYRDRIHDMPNVAMYMAREVPVDAARPIAGHAQLVGVLAMKPGYGFKDHEDYEKALEPITARHGMRLVRSFRVTQDMGGGENNNIVAVNVWDLPKPEALGQVMNDPEYVANIDYRNRIHDMAATTMYFVSPR